MKTSKSKFAVSFLLWNIQRKELSKLVAQLVNDLGSDVIVLVEHHGLDIVNLSKLLTTEFEEVADPVLQAIQGGEKMPARIFIRSARVSASPLTAETRRYSALTLRPQPLSREILLIAVHLPDKMNNRDSEQTTAAVKFSDAISQIEDRYGLADTLVLGDFNMNPFEPGMVNREAFNAVPTRSEARCITRTKNNVAYKTFYNPCWCLFSDFSGMPPGTHYYKSGNIKWNVLDQVLLRPGLIENFRTDSLRVLDRSGGVSMRTAKGVPRAKDGSDHLPISFVLDF